MCRLDCESRNRWREGDARGLLGDGVKEIEKVVIAFALIEVALLRVRILLWGSASGC